ncbi:hypothetical protein NKG94_17605 [Micromonospora sp. M12]
MANARTCWSGMFPAHAGDPRSERGSLLGRSCSPRTRVIPGSRARLGRPGRAPRARGDPAEAYALAISP